MLKKEVAEQWKPITIPEFVGYYEVSNYSRLRTIPRLYQTGNGRAWRMSKQKILKPSRSGKYLKYSIQVNKIRRTCLAHRLGALAWVPNPNNLPQVNHIDTDKSNNYIGNFEWCSGDYNMEHASKNGLIKVGERHNTHASNKPKPIVQYDLNGGLIKSWNSTKEAARVLNFDHTLIGKCAKGIVTHAYNFIFKYA